MTVQVKIKVEGNQPGDGVMVYGVKETESGALECLNKEGCAFWEDYSYVAAGEERLLINMPADHYKLPICVGLKEKHG